MGRPDQTLSPGMHNNFNPMFHPQPAPEPTVYENQIVDTEQKYIQTGVPNMPRPVPPTYINPGRMGNQPYVPPQMARPVNQPSNWTSGLFDCMNDGENG
ncbi:protein PLANT CADMIUM RESISTANCE 6-like [Brassica napus]|uniref:protein PLANT CADMIUM RESISTANCE 6-like n=1 Tax=Brassica napus TaxID=3708 RepID=UPI002078F94A|nr:protein PLANT CADMIUM RESISTANCE 6-like [Brassica napus]